MQVVWIAAWVLTNEEFSSFYTLSEYCRQMVYNIVTVIQSSSQYVVSRLCISTKSALCMYICSKSEEGNNNQIIIVGDETSKAAENNCTAFIYYA